MFGSLINMALSPVRVVANVVDVGLSLTQGEINARAIAALGEEAVRNMTQAEIVEYVLGK